MPAIALCLEAPLSLRGGVSVLVEALIEGLATDFRIVLVSPDSPDTLSAADSRPGIWQHVYWEAENYSPTKCKALATRLAELQVSIIHLHSGNNAWRNRWTGTTPVSYLSDFGIPTITTNHIVVTPWDNYCDPAHASLLWKMLTLPLAWIGKLLFLRHVHKEIAVSHHNCQLLKRWYWPFRDRFEVIYHSRIREKKVPAFRDEREKTVLAVGHIAFRKGQHLLAEAFAHIAPSHPGWKLMLIGYDAQPACTEAIRTIATKAGLSDRIVLLGSRKDAVDFMKKAAIFVQPSLHEGLPLALQEALYYGCACIGTRVSGTPELIDHEVNGLLVEASNVAQLGAAMERLIGNSALRSQLSMTGPESIVRKGMTSEQMVAKHRELYGKILDLSAKEVR